MKAWSEQTQLIVAEKPSVARAIADALSEQEPERHEGYIRVGHRVITWTFGHMVELFTPGDYHPDWMGWHIDQLPIVPEAFRWKIKAGMESHFYRLKELLFQPCVTELLAATDAGREGELIFRLLWQHAGKPMPFRRVWLTALSTEAIRTAFEQPLPAENFDGLAESAFARQQADWLLGINLSRLLSLKLAAKYHVGRVQTPTLAMIVGRDAEVDAFSPRSKYLVCGEISWRYAAEPTTSSRKLLLRYLPDGEADRAGPERAKFQGFSSYEGAKEVLAAMPLGAFKLESPDYIEKTVAAPPLFDLTAIQQEAFRCHSYTAKQTLDHLQSLYELGFISYPRTDCSKVPMSIGEELGMRAKQLAPAHGVDPGCFLDVSDLGPRYLAADFAEDHHALLPASHRTDGVALSLAQKNLLTMIERRVLMAFLGPETLLVGRFVLRQQGHALMGELKLGRTKLGWSRLRAQASDDVVGDSPEKISIDIDTTSLGLHIVEEPVMPPVAYNDASLLADMVDHEHSLGTAATRAHILESLVSHGYVVRDGVSLVATGRGRLLLAGAPQQVCSRKLTSEWETGLAQIEKKCLSSESFLGRLCEDLRALMANIKEPQPPKARLVSILQEVFGHQSFRPFQRQVCEAVVAGQDSLVVMPTGAGKSLCYMLPAMALQGVGLVVSPLIALMEDQVSKLQARGLRAERIHSGRSREESRDACRAYLKGDLDFLYVAPERLRLTGFVEVLSSRLPSLIAVDEAHCISHWGHDFRPDYRMLRERLAPLREAPIIALTATATVQVQTDIAAQLGIVADQVFVYGFKRDNISVEVVELAPEDRPSAVKELLSTEQRRPAIVYGSTRKAVEALGVYLSVHYKCGVYHAGLPGRERDSVQKAFQSGDLDVIVATNAFGMGVDKGNIRTVIHSGPSSSVEGYYQEIGRAGRDGEFSKAIAFYHHSDLRTLRFLFERSYPAVAMLKHVFRQLGEGWIYRDQLNVQGDQDLLATILEKLWIHGGVLVDSQDRVQKKDDNWVTSYEEQRNNREKQLDDIYRYFMTADCCRMQQLVRYFGESGAHQVAPCGICDVCAPKDSLCLEQNAPSARARRFFEMLRDSGFSSRFQSIGRIYKEVGAAYFDHKESMCHFLAGLTRVGLGAVDNHSFERNGQLIFYLAFKLHKEGELPEEIPFQRQFHGASAGAVRSKTRTSPKNLDEELYGRLQKWRRSEAEKLSIPSFCVLPDKTLKQLALERPESKSDLTSISGIGPAKAEKYGTALLAAIVGGRRQAGKEPPVGRRDG